MCFFAAIILIMRTLYYVPIIHTGADMGSLSKALAACGVSHLGEKKWHEHTGAVQKFWDVIADYAAALPADGLKIYQDGLVADGDIGLKIVAAGVRAGSPNYRIVEMLVRRGAEIVKTEDFRLVLEERDRLLAIVEAPSGTAKIFAALKYRFLKNRLLDRRDAFIARRIAETLPEGGGGILFIGAYHKVRQRLPKDIEVIELKEAGKIRRYQELLLPRNGHQDEFSVLSRYLEAPVERGRDNSGRDPQNAVYGTGADE